MATPRIKVHCIAVIDRCTVPQAVLVADIRIGHEKARYVLLDSETRDALSRMRQGPKASSFGDVISVRNGRDAFPETIRTHAFDSAGLIHDDCPLHTRKGIWSNAESLWVRADYAEMVLKDLEDWREANPVGKQSIHAPNWLALVGVQSLALAARFPMPGPNGMGLDHPDHAVT